MQQILPYEDMNQENGHNFSWTIYRLLTNQMN